MKGVELKEGQSKTEKFAASDSVWCLDSWSPLFLDSQLKSLGIDLMAW